MIVDRLRSIDAVIFERAACEFLQAAFPKWFADLKVRGRAGRTPVPGWPDAYVFEDRPPYACASFTIEQGPSKLEGKLRDDLAKAKEWIAAVGSLEIFAFVSGHTDLDPLVVGEHSDAFRSAGVKRVIVVTQRTLSARLTDPKYHFAWDVLDLGSFAPCHPFRPLRRAPVFGRGRHDPRPLEAEFISGDVEAPAVRDEVRDHLARERAALVRADAGHGKTTLGVVLGLEHEKTSRGSTAYYIDCASATQSAATKDRALDVFRVRNADWAMFILDNAHRDVAFAVSIAEVWRIGGRKGSLLFLSERRDDTSVVDEDIDDVIPVTATSLHSTDVDLRRIYIRLAKRFVDDSAEPREPSPQERQTWEAFSKELVAFSSALLKKLEDGAESVAIDRSDARKRVNQRYLADVAGSARVDFMRLAAAGALAMHIPLSKLDAGFPAGSAGEAVQRVWRDDEPYVQMIHQENARLILAADRIENGVAADNLVEVAKIHPPIAWPIARRLEDECSKWVDVTLEQWEDAARRCISEALDCERGVVLPRNLSLLARGIEQTIALRVRDARACDRLLCAEYEHLLDCVRRATLVQVSSFLEFAGPVLPGTAALVCGILTRPGELEPVAENSGAKGLGDWMEQPQESIKAPVFAWLRADNGAKAAAIIGGDGLPALSLYMESQGMATEARALLMRLARDVIEADAPASLVDAATLIYANRGLAGVLGDLLEETLVATASVVAVTLDGALSLARADPRLMSALVMNRSIRERLVQVASAADPRLLLRVLSRLDQTARAAFADDVGELGEALFARRPQRVTSWHWLGRVFDEVGRPDIADVCVSIALEPSYVKAWQKAAGTSDDVVPALFFAMVRSRREDPEFARARHILQTVCSAEWLEAAYARTRPRELAAATYAVWSFLPPEFTTALADTSFQRRVAEAAATLSRQRGKALLGAFALLGAASCIASIPDIPNAPAETEISEALQLQPQVASTRLTYSSAVIWIGLRAAKTAHPAMLLPADALRRAQILWESSQPRTAAQSGMRLNMLSWFASVLADPRLLTIPDAPPDDFLT